MSLTFLLGGALDEQDTLAVALSTEFNTMKEAIRKKPGSFHFNPDRFFLSVKTEDWKAQLPEAAIALINAKTAEKWGSAEAIAPQAPHLDNGDLTKFRHRYFQISQYVIHIIQQNCFIYYT